MEPSQLLRGLFDQKRISLIKLFLDNPDHEYGVREAAKASKLPPATTHRILHTLLEQKIIAERRVKKLRLYKRAETKEAAFLDDLLAVKKSAIEEFTERARALEGVRRIIQHGPATKEKVNVLVIGDSVDTAALARIVGEIKAAYGFTILHLALSPEQYEQMSSMGLYAGEKQVLSG